MRTVLAIAVLVGLGGVARAESHMVVPRATPIRLRADPNAPAARAGDAPGLAAYFDFENVADAGNGLRFVRPTISGPCYEGPRNFDFDGPMYVPSEAAVQVVKREIVVRGEEGTGLVIRPGVPVTFEGDLAAFHPNEPGLVVRAPRTQVPEDAIGSSYEPDPRPSTDLRDVPFAGPDESDRAFALRPGTTVTLLGLSQKLSEARLDVLAAEDGRYAASVPGLLVVFRAPPSTVRTLPSVVPVIAPGRGRWTVCTTPYFNARTGARRVEVADAYDESGARLGGLRACQRLNAEARPANGRRCFRVPVDEGGRGGVPFVVCFDPGDVESGPR